MKKYIYSIVAATALFASCSQDAELNEIGNTEPNAITTIGASTELSSRAVVSSTDNTKVNWETGDQLGVLGTNGSSEENLAYTLDSGSGSTSGTFTNGTSDITAISAVMYPYQENATWADSKLTCEIPSVQTATKGSFDKTAAIMYSIGSTTDVKLNYAVNFLKVTISESETDVHAISISSTTTELSGKMEITSSGVTAATSGSLKSVTLTAGKGNVLAAGDYYIAVKAGNIDNPTISYVYLDQTNHTATEKTKAGTGTLSFTAGTNVKPIKVNFSNGTVTTRNAVQLWENGPYFAEYNVGATSATEVGTPMTFTEATTTSYWGSNWRTPSKDDELDELLKAATADGSTKVTCTLVRENDEETGKIIGFKFTGKETSYTGNSVFFPAQYGGSYRGDAGCWSGTASGSDAWYMGLSYDYGNWGSYWYEDNQGSKYLVRPVLKN